MKLTEINDCGQTVYMDSNRQILFPCCDCGEPVEECYHDEHNGLCAECWEYQHTCQLCNESGDHVQLKGDCLCPECYDRLHVCQSCGSEYMAELAAGIGENRYCEKCYREVTKSAVKFAIQEIQKISEVAKSEPEQVRVAHPNDYVCQAGSLRGSMDFMAGRIDFVLKILGVL